MRHVRRILKKQPWILGLDLEAQVRPGVECLKVMLDMPTDQVSKGRCLEMQHGRGWEWGE